MPMKEWFRNLKPAQLYVVLVLTVIFFLTELVCSHVTHALTLLMDSYHMLCNIMALTGCILTIKNSKEPPSPPSSKCDESDKSTKSKRTISHQQNQLINTFGWARIDVMSMLICTIFLASLSFSVVVEALQTLVHIDHFDEMHHPIPVLFIGAAGIFLNGVCYLLIGGYTFHQASFLFITESGDVVLDRVVVPELVAQGGRRLSRSREAQQQMQQQTKVREGFWEMVRDVLGCVLVVICSVLVYFTDKNIAKYIDPLISIASAIFLMVLSYPHMKESCLILLQTIPGSIDIEYLEHQLRAQFPDIKNVHDFHVWQLTTNKVISTVHIVFQSKTSYAQMMLDIKDFLVENGITQVTIQPEFLTKAESEDDLKKVCLMQCQEPSCEENHCCPRYLGNAKVPKLCSKVSKATEKEVVMLANSLPDLRSLRIINNELSKTMECLSTLPK